MPHPNAPDHGWRPASRYPDPAIEVLDERFRPYRLNSAAIERLHTGMRWAEGPVWFGDGGYLLCSDIPNNRVLKWEAGSGAVSAWRSPSGFANGHTRDRQGRLITCEHGGRRVVRTEYDGSLTIIADRFQGKPLNSPNDVVVKSDDTIWFSDPPFGILGHYEGHAAPAELPTHLYRFDPRGGVLTVACSDISRQALSGWSQFERTSRPCRKVHPRIRPWRKRW